MQVKGLTHIHSHFSDGMLSLAQIKNRAKKRGMNFVLMADHLSRLPDFGRLNKECEELSDDDFLMVPGAEIASREGYHFLIYNVTELPRSLVDYEVSFKELDETFSSQERLLVLAHASLYSKLPSREIVERLDGIEVWNTKYDTRYAPHLKSLQFALTHNLVPFAAVDAHGPFSLRKLWLELELPELERSCLISSLKQGLFKIANCSFSLDLREKLTPAQALPFQLNNKLYAPLRYPMGLFVKSRLRCPKIFIRLFQKLYD